MITQLTSAMGKQKQPQTTYNIHIYDIKLRYYKRETQNANMVSKSGIETRTLYARGMLNIIWVVFFAILKCRLYKLYNRIA